MRIRALLIACLVAATSILIATPAQAAPATVYIYKVYYNSPGSDTGSNSSLNAEYVGSGTVTMSLTPSPDGPCGMRPDTSTSSAPCGWGLASRPLFTPAMAPATPPLP